MSFLFLFTLFLNPRFKDRYYALNFQLIAFVRNGTRIRMATQVPCLPKHLYCDWGLWKPGWCTADDTSWTLLKCQSCTANLITLNRNQWVWDHRCHMVLTYEHWSISTRWLKSLGILWTLLSKLVNVFGNTKRLFDSHKFLYTSFFPGEQQRAGCKLAAFIDSMPGDNSQKCGVRLLNPVRAVVFDFFSKNSSDSS